MSDKLTYCSLTEEKFKVIFFIFVHLCERKTNFIEKKIKILGSLIMQKFTIVQ